MALETPMSQWSGRQLPSCLLYHCYHQQPLLRRASMARRSSENNGAYWIKQIHKWMIQICYPSLFRLKFPEIPAIRFISCDKVLLPR